MKYTTNYNLKKPEGSDVVNIDDLNDNADILDQKLKEVENKADNAPPNSVNDAAIGSRTPDQSQAPASPGTGTLTQLISWLANRIKAITGKTNWWDAPPTTLQAAKTHMDSAAPHSGHETPAGAQAKAEAAAGAVQAELDVHVADTASHGATSTNTASRIVMRDASGNFSAGTITATLNGSADKVDNIHFRIYNGSLQYNDGSGWKNVMTSVIKSIQRGTAEVAHDTTITISAVDTRKAVISLTGGLYGGSYVYSVYLTLDSQTTLTIHADTSATVSWQVVEYV